MPAEAWWVAAATVVAAVLWTRELAAPLFVDEAASWTVAAQDTWGGFWGLLHRQEIAPPPFYLGLRAVVHGLGADGHSAMRLPVVVASLPVVPFGALLARRIGATPFGVAATGWLLALSPLLLQHGQQVRAYGPAAAAAVAAAVLLLTAAERRWTARWTAAAGIATAGAVWVHYLAAPPLAVLAVGLLWRAPAAPRLRMAVLVLPAWLAAALYARSQYGHAGAGVDGATDLGGLDLERVLATAWQGRVADDPLPRIAGIAALALALVLLAGGSWRRRLVLLAGLSGPALIVAVSALGPDIVTSRYLVPAAPFLLAGIGAALTARPLPIAVAVALSAAATLGTLHQLDPQRGRYADIEAQIAGIGDLPPGAVVASRDASHALYRPAYVGARMGSPRVEGAWGRWAVRQAACDRRIVRQLVPSGVSPEPMLAWWRAAGYAARVRPTATPGIDVVIANPPPTGAPHRCPDAAPPGW